MTIGEKIRTAREAKELTVDELSALSGVDNSLIDKYEANQMKPRYSTLNKLADALDVKPVELYNDETNKASCEAAAEEIFKDEITDYEPPYDLLHEFAEQLKYLRLCNIITQEQLAEEVGISVEEIAQYENGEAAPDIITLNSLASYFKVSTDYILGNSTFSKNDESFRKFAKSIEQLAELHTKGALSDDLYELCFNAVIAECAYDICVW